MIFMRFGAELELLNKFKQDLSKEKHRGRLDYI